MSSEPTGRPEEPGHGAPGEPGEEEMRAAYEAELNRMSSSDVIAQAAVSLLNLGARRLGLLSGEGSAGAPERDLEQTRDAIDAARALLEILERRVPDSVRPLRDALAQLQIAYAREAQAPAAPAPSEPGSGAQRPDPATGSPGEPGPAGATQAPGDQTGGPGPAQKSGRLWVPGS